MRRGGGTAPPRGGKPPPRGGGRAGGGAGPGGGGGSGEGEVELPQLERGEEGGRARRAIGRGLGERPGEHVVVVRRQRGVPPPGRRGVLVHDAVDDGRQVLPREGALSGDRLVHDDRQRENVRRRGHLPAQDLLRRHVRGGAEDLARLRHHRGLDVRNAEVRQLWLPVGEHHDVGGLYVAVDEAP